MWKNNFKGSSDKKKENVPLTSELWKIICMNVYTTLYVVTSPRLTNFRRYNAIGQDREATRKTECANITRHSCPRQHGG